MSYKLFLDDFRFPEDAGNYMHPQFKSLYNDPDWEVVRNYDQFVSFIERLGIPYIVSFDHDLADEHYAPTGISYDDFVEKTGYHCMKWMIQYITENKIKELPKVIVHSANPVGVENIEKLWFNFKRHYKWDSSKE